MRPTKEIYFMEMAHHVKKRATCPRRQVGAVFVRQGRVLVTGYNGSRPGAQHCTEVGCLMIHDHCKRTIHAETNGIIQAAKHGVSLENAHLYVTTMPCLTCYNNVVTAGIQRIYYTDEYHGREQEEVLKAGAIILEKVTL